MELVTSLLDAVPWLQYVLSGLGALVVLGQVVVAITPGKKDDEWLEKQKNGVLGKLMDALKAFAPIQKKSK